MSTLTEIPRFLKVFHLFWIDPQSSYERHALFVETEPKDGSGRLHELYTTPEDSTICQSTSDTIYPDPEGSKELKDNLKKTEIGHVLSYFYEHEFNRVLNAALAGTLSEVRPVETGRKTRSSLSMAPPPEPPKEGYAYLVGVLADIQRNIMAGTRPMGSLIGSLIEVLDHAGTLYKKVPAQETGQKRVRR